MRNDNFIGNKFEIQSNNVWTSNLHLISYKLYWATLKKQWTKNLVERYAHRACLIKIKHFLLNELKNAVIRVPN